MKIIFALLSCLLLCACAPSLRFTEHTATTGVLTISAEAIEAARHKGEHASPPPGCQIIENPQPNGTFYAVKIADFTLAPYALYDTRQGAIDCAWLCYRPAKEAKP